MNPRRPSRRELLKSASCGFGYLAFAGMSSLQAASSNSPLAPKTPHFAARARRVIFLCMNGAPSHVDTFDYKPELSSSDGKSSSRPGRIPGAKLMGSPWPFKQHGASGLWVSDLFPEVASRADELCVLRGMQTDLPAHPEAYLMLHTGSSQFIRPSLGAWTLYGLGTESDDLPGFISIKPTGRNGGAQNYGSAFLPAACQATRIGNEGQTVAEARVGNIKNPRIDPSEQRRQLDLIQAMNRDLIERERVYPEVDGVIESYELAFRMQGRLPGVMDLSQESAETGRLYGLDDAATADFGRGCLLARRFVEAGVRFVELTHGDWDQHRGLRAGHARNARAVDRPIAGLLTDLRARGLLEDTLVVWGGEFGRTPHGQNADGRDHNNKGFTCWLAGAGVKRGFAYGQTDELGYEAVESPMHVHDLHATILHLLGLDHERLTYRYAGRDMRLTDVKGIVHKAILA
ncbi:MAG TPA: DUF1501 domain-containing protein [Pirellulales bacterium]|jgi:hypothetical protein|nr:DUF1501 domain-containing protein [Pirellulales bacterium]